MPLLSVPHCRQYAKLLISVVNLEHSIENSRVAVNNFNIYAIIDKQNCVDANKTKCF